MPHLDTQAGRGGEVDGGIAHAAGEQQLEPRQAAQQGRVETAALAHHADHLERRQALAHGGGVAGVVMDKADLANARQQRPVDDVTGDVLPIIDYRDLHTHEGSRENASM